VTCRELIGFLDDYLDGGLDAPVRQRFEEHLRVCIDCTNYLDSYRRTIALGKAAFAPAATPDAPTPSDVPAGLLKAILAARPRR
jgi:anti-sigma factor RsiW